MPWESNPPDPSHATKFRICTFYFNASSSLTDNEQLLSIQTTYDIIFAVPIAISYPKIKPTTGLEPITSIPGSALPIELRGHMRLIYEYPVSIPFQRIKYSNLIVEAEGFEPPTYHFRDCSSLRALLLHRLSCSALCKETGLSFTFM